MRFWLAVLVVVAIAPAVRAAPCGNLGGDAELAAAIEQVLAQREVRCDDVRGEVRYDGAAIVVTSGDPIPLERRVGDVATAATVVESWLGASVADPLLAIRPVPVLAVAPPAPAPRVVIVERQVPVTAPVRGFQLFATGETSIANDRTSWLGLSVGGCIVIGPLCASARVRFATVVDGPGPLWDDLERRGVELLVGGEIPLQVGSGQLLLGFGGGTGQMHTKMEREGPHMGSETGGLRADVHASWAYPIGHDLAVELSLAVDLTQATRTESMVQEPLPDEPLVLGRFGIGLRYGSLR